MRNISAGTFIILLLFVRSVFSSEPVLLSLKTTESKKATEVLVKYRPGTKVKKASGYQGTIWQLQLERYAVPLSETAESLAAKMRKDKNVEWAQPNYWRYALATEVVPDDPYYRPERNQRQYQQWYLPKINANFAWSLARGSDAIVVAVVDSGVDLNHPDLKARLVQGVSIVNQDDYTPPADGMDDHGHGTQVAGIIGALTNNNLGISGCSWNGKIMPVKVLNNKGEGTDADIAEGIIWAVDSGAKIINLSLGGPSDDGTPPQVLQSAIDYAYDQGCMVIAAAGNSGDNTIHYPAALHHVLAVAATDPWDQRASYSTSGSYVDLAAPGGAGGDSFSRDTGILSTYWNENSQITDFSSGSEAGEYAITAGTSMAAAVVSGIALVTWSYQYTLTVDQLENVIKTSATDIGTAGADEETGAGRVDLLAALGNPPVEQPELTLYNYPNPFNPEVDGQTQIVFLLDQPCAVELKIYDSARDLVWMRSLSSSETLSGKNSVIWNGRNEVGERVANGVYFYRITTADGLASKIKTIAVLR